MNRTMRGKKKEKQAVQSNNVFTFIQKVWQEPKGKALVFFAFYFFFFLFIAISYRSAAEHPKQSFTFPTTNFESKKNYTIDSLVNGNYQFTYQEFVNDVSKEFTGKCYQKMKQLTSSTQEEYFLYSGISLVHQNDVWQVSANPFHLRELMEEEKIEELLSKATFISKTVYSDDSSLYRYEVSTSTLSTLYQKESIDIADAPNTIELLVGKDKNIQSIHYDFSSYESYLKGSPQSFTATVLYANYGEVEAFEIPN